MKPHLSILGLIVESNLGLGRQLVAEVLTGELNSRIKKLKLDKLVHFDSLPLYDKKDIFELMDLLLYKKYIEYRPVPNNKFIKVLHLTEKGKDELRNPCDDITVTKSFNGYYSKIDMVTENDKKVFETLKDQLKYLSNEQKKAIISNKKNILCIAGAGSGKTRVLTKRAEFLSKFRSAKKILCITHELAAMCEGIARCLKPGGRFVTVNCSPLLNFKTAPSYRHYGFETQAIGDFREGMPITWRFFLDDGAFEIENYFLDDSVHDEMFRSAGFREIRWHRPRLSPEGVARHGRDYWRCFMDHPPIAAVECIK